MLFSTFVLRAFCRRVALSALATAMLCMSAYAQGNSAAPDHIPGRLLVQHRASADLASDDELLEEAKAKVLARIEPLHVSVLSLPEAAVRAALEALEGFREVCVRGTGLHGSWRCFIKRSQLSFSVASHQDQHLFGLEHFDRLRFHPDRCCGFRS